MSCSIHCMIASIAQHSTTTSRTIWTCTAFQYEVFDKAGTLNRKHCTRLNVEGMQDSRLFPFKQAGKSWGRAIVHEFETLYDQMYNGLHYMARLQYGSINCCRQKCFNNRIPPPVQTAESSFFSWYKLHKSLTCVEHAVPLPHQLMTVRPSIAHASEYLPMQASEEKHYHRAIFAQTVVR